MKHLHTESVAYDGRSYCRTYTHNHAFDHEAHIHIHAWEGKANGESHGHPMSRGKVPVVQTVRTVVEVEV